MNNPNGSKLLLPPNLSCLAKLAAKESGAKHYAKYAINGVRVESTASSGYRVIATDGRVLGVVTGDMDNPGDYPDLDDMRNEATETSAIIPMKAWVDAFRSIPKRPPNQVLKNVAVVLGKETSVLATTDLDQHNVLRPRNIDGRRPDYEKLFQGKKPKVSFRVDPKLFAKVLEVAAVFTDDDDIVTVEVHDREISISAQKNDQRFFGAVALINDREEGSVDPDTAGSHLQGADL